MKFRTVPRKPRLFCWSTSRFSDFLAFKLSFPRNDQHEKGVTCGLVFFFSRDFSEFSNSIPRGSKKTIIAIWAKSCIPWGVPEISTPGDDNSA